MPILHFPDVSRRKFLVQSASALATVLSARSFSADAVPGAAHWTLLSDTHIPADPSEAYRGFRPYENLKSVMPQLSQAAPDGVIICGDVARLEGFVADYERVRELLQPLPPALPVVMALGNHDHRQNFSSVFERPAAFGEKSPVNGKHVVVIEQQPVRLIVLDSLMFVNEVPGLLGQAQRDWLAGYLDQADDIPTVLFVHHTLGEGDGELLDVPRLFSLVEPMRKVKAIFFGHSHVYSYDERAGIHLVNLPAVGYSFTDDQPVGWVDARFTRTGGTFRLHAIAGNQEHDQQITELTWR